MATSSITHNFVISNPKSIESFVSAIEAADHDRLPARHLQGRLLTSPKDILTLMERRRGRNVEPRFRG